MSAPSWSTTAVAAYGALLSSILGLSRFGSWLLEHRRRVDVRLFLSPLVIDDNGNVRVRNAFGHPVIQEGEAREFIVVRAHNRGPQVLVTRVELEGREGSPEHLTWLTMPTSLEKGDVQLWYTKAGADLPVDVRARITLADGKRIPSSWYPGLSGYLDPLDPTAGRELPWRRDEGSGRREGRLT